MLTVTECYKVLGLYLIHLQGGHNICFVNKESRGLENMDGCPELTQPVCVGTGVQPEGTLSLLQLVCIHLTRLLQSVT